MSDVLLFVVSSCNFLFFNFTCEHELPRLLSLLLFSFFFFIFCPPFYYFCCLRCLQLKGAYRVDVPFYIWGVQENDNRHTPFFCCCCCCCWVASAEITGINNDNKYTTTTAKKKKEWGGARIKKRDICDTPTKTCTKKGWAAHKHWLKKKALSAPCWTLSSDHTNTLFCWYWLLFSYLFFFLLYHSSFLSICVYWHISFFFSSSLTSFECPSLFFLVLSYTILIWKDISLFLLSRLGFLI